MCMEKGGTRFGSADDSAPSAALAGIAVLVLLPQGHRVRPWLWAGMIAALAYSRLALIARFVHLA